MTLNIKLKPAHEKEKTQKLYQNKPVSGAIAPCGMFELSVVIMVIGGMWIKLYLMTKVLAYHYKSESTEKTCILNKEYFDR